MDDAGGLGRGGADGHGPGAHFLHAGGEVGLQAQQLEGGADQAVQARFFHAHVLQEGFAVGVVEVDDFGFDGGADRDDGRVAGGGEFGQAVEQRVVGEAVVSDVAHVHRALGGDEAELGDVGLFFGRQVQRADGLGFVELGDALFQHGHEALRFLVARTRGLLVALQRLFGGLQIGQGQFGFDDFDVGDRVDLAGDVDHVGIFEAAHDVNDGIGFADVREELVAQAFALARAGDQARDVDEFDGGGQDAFGLDDFGQLLQARIRHFDDADVGLDGAERIVLGGDAGAGQSVEESRFANVGQADDAALQSHGNPV